jgi:hypothetical protein
MYVYVKEDGRLRLIGSSSASLSPYLPIYRVPVQTEMNREWLGQRPALDVHGRTVEFEVRKTRLFGAPAQILIARDPDDAAHLPGWRCA